VTPPLVLPGSAARLAPEWIYGYVRGAGFSPEESVTATAIALVVAGELGEAEITTALLHAATAAGLGQVEAAHAIASGLAAGQDPTRHHALARRQVGGAR
jgi:hypothetical protein